MGLLPESVVGVGEQGIKGSNDIDEGIGVPFDSGALQKKVALENKDKNPELLWNSVVNDGAVGECGFAQRRCE